MVAILMVFERFLDEESRIKNREQRTEKKKQETRAKNQDKLILGLLPQLDVSF